MPITLTNADLVTLYNSNGTEVDWSTGTIQNGKFVSFASGTLERSFGKAQVMMGGAAQVSTDGKTSTSALYIVDTMAGSTHDQVELDVFKQSQAIGTYDVTGTMTFYQAIPLPQLVGGSAATASMAGAGGDLFIGTNQGLKFAIVDKTSLAATYGSGFIADGNVTSITSGSDKFTSVVFGSKDPFGTILYGPDGTIASDGGGASYEPGSIVGIQPVSSGANTLVRARDTVAAPPLDSTTYTVIMSDGQYVDVVVCGVLGNAAGCFGGTGTQGFTNVGSLLQNPPVTVGSNTFTREIDIVDKQSGSGNNLLTLYQYQEKQVINGSSDRVSVTLLNTVSTTLPGTAASATFLTATTNTLTLASSLSGTRVTIDRTTGAATSVATPTGNVTAVTANENGFGLTVNGSGNAASYALTDAAGHTATGTGAFVIVNGENATPLSAPANRLGSSQSPLGFLPLATPARLGQPE